MSNTVPVITVRTEMLDVIVFYASVIEIACENFSLTLPVRKRTEEIAAEAIIL